MSISPKIIDHTNLNADATDKDIEKLCEEAKQYGFGTVCVYSKYVPLCRNLLKGTQVKICSVIGFPKGTESTKQKVNEAEQAVKDGADELDMVIDVPALKKGEYDHVKNDIAAVKNAAKGKLLKVIIEAGMLNDDQKRKACQLAEQGGADYVKTSTGFAADDKGNKLGATVEDVRVMKEVVGNRLGIKAAGGIKTSEYAQQLIDAGATRIGATASIALVEDKYMSENVKELWWKYFEFHADQRLRAFYFFLIIIGALSVAYYTCLRDCYLRDFAPNMCLLSMFTALGFFFLEIRNVQLVNTGREALKRLMPEIEGSDSGLNKAWGSMHYLRYIPFPGWVRSMFFPFIRHQFWLRLIYLIVFFAALQLYYGITDKMNLFFLLAFLGSYFSTIKIGNKDC